MTTVYPLKFQLGPLEITGFGIMMMAAFLVGGWLIARQLREQKLNEDYAGDIVFGDLDDPESAVSRLSRSSRGSKLLEDRGTEPAVTYLSRQS